MADFHFKNKFYVPVYYSVEETKCKIMASKFVNKTMADFHFKKKFYVPVYYSVEETNGHSVDETNVK